VVLPSAVSPYCLPILVALGRGMHLVFAGPGREALDAPT
jgi:hypothetical protein